MSKSVSRALVMSVVCLAFAWSGLAGVCNWKAGVTGDWSASGNWVDGVVPVGGDDVTITNAGAVAILSSASADLGSITIGKTLVFTNWGTLLTATNVTILTNGLVTLPTPFNDSAMSNNVSISCTNLTIDAGGRIDVSARGYAGGAVGVNGYGPGFGRAATDASAAGHGGRGGDGGNGVGTMRAGGIVYDSATAPTAPGSGGGGGNSGTGGAGGGAVRIAAPAGQVTINGTINASAGAGGSQFAGGGSGGSVYITCRVLVGGVSGLVSADGGDASTYGASGGGGRIAVVYDVAEQDLVPLPAIRFSARRGPTTLLLAGYPRGPALDYERIFLDPVGQLGTLYFTDSRLINDSIRDLSGVWMAPMSATWSVNSLLVSNSHLRILTDDLVLTVTNGMVVKDSSRLEVTNATVTVGQDMLITNSAFVIWGGSTSRPTVNVGGNLKVFGGTTATSGQFMVYAGFTNATYPDYGALVSVTGDVYCGTNGWIRPMSQPTNGGSVLFRAANVTIATAKAGFSADVGGYKEGSDGTTYVNGFGPGGGKWTASIRHTGAGHGGVGAWGSSSTTNVGGTYGYSNAPIEPGSAGASGYQYLSTGGRGGGLVRVRATGTITVNGTISANAGRAGGGQYGSGGSGGGVYLSCVGFTGTTNGLIAANGGDSGYAGAVAGGGGGGRVAVVRRPSLDTYLGSLVAITGRYGYLSASNGTVVLLIDPNMPLCVNRAAENVLAGSADMIGEVTSTGTSPTEVYCYWGTNDAGTTFGAWGATNYLGTNGVGLVTNVIASGLSPSTRYYYRFFVTNSAAGDWAPSTTNLDTLGSVSVDNLGGPTNVTTTTATLRGEVVSGSPSPDVFVCWGDNEGTANTASWDYVESMGVQAPAVMFSANVSGLLANKTYYYRCYATNIYGGSWAPAATNFTTASPTLAIGDAVVLEGPAATTTAAVFTVTMSATSAVDVTTAFASSNDTASAPADFDATNGTLTIAAGSVVGTIAVTVLGDSLDEYPAETFGMVLSTPVNASFSRAEGLGTITDDDDAAETRTWSGVGDWNSATNWSPSGAPSPSDSAVVSGGSVTLTNPVTLVALSITNATLTISRWDSTITAPGISIFSNGVVTLGAAFTNNAMSNRVHLVCTDLLVGPGGRIDADGKGYAGGGVGTNGFGPGFGRTETDASGAGHGGKGGDGGLSSLRAGGIRYGEYDVPTAPGSGGGGGASGTGGAGGGAVRVEASGTVTVNGTVSANGGAGGLQFAGGGSGGSIYITCQKIEGSGLVRADGGEASNYGASGGGGRIAIVYDTGAQTAVSVPAVRFSAGRGPLTLQFAGYPRWPNITDVARQLSNPDGQLGTLYFADSRFLVSPVTHKGEWMAPLASGWAIESLTVSGGDLRIPIDGWALTVTNQLTMQGGGRLELTNAAVTCGQDLVLTNGSLVIAGGSTSRPSVSVGGRVRVIGSASTSSLFRIYAGMTNAAAPDYGALVSVVGDVTIGTNGWISPMSHPTNGGSVLFRMANLTIADGACGFNADGGGFRQGSDGSVSAKGLGYGGGSGQNSRNCGGGYGGIGGFGQTGFSGPVGPVYGYSNAPVDCGSAGGSGAAYSWYGGRGGGLVRVEARNIITVNGTVTANGGKAANYGGGGSGGGIYLRCLAFNGGSGGLLRANGYDSGYLGAVAGGGGGGRIAVWRRVTRHWYQGAYSVAYGAGGEIAAAVGTIYLGDAPMDTGSIFLVH